MKKIPFLFILSSLFISACKKSHEGPTSPGITNADSIYIKSIVILDNPRFPPYDTLFKFFFSYDASKRVAGLHEFTYDNNFPAGLDLLEARYQYTGADTVPSMVYIRSTYFLSVWHTLYLSYTNGWIYRDSNSYNLGPGSPNSFTKLDFLQTGPGRWSVQMIDSTVGSLAYRKEMRASVNWQNGNLMAEHDTSGSAIYADFYTYDNHPNPLQRAFLNFPFYRITTELPEGVFGSIMMKGNFRHRSANNLLTELHYPPGETATWQYEYNNNGLPKTAIVTRGLTENKVYYYYTSL